MVAASLPGQAVTTPLTSLSWLILHPQERRSADGEDEDEDNAANKKRPRPGSRPRWVWLEEEEDLRSDLRPTHFLAGWDQPSSPHFSSNCAYSQLVCDIKKGAILFFTQYILII